MIVWLASYPRSGNTFLRIVLKNLYGLGTYSVYNDPALDRLGISDVVGHIALPRGKIAELQGDREVHFVKTHELPPSGADPSIYLVRDGRDALVSYAHYLGRVEGKPGDFEQRLAETIAGDCPFGRWSDHVVAWLDNAAPTAVIKYEDLVADPPGIVRAALAHVGLEQIAPVRSAGLPEFGELHSRAPAFFRKGKPGQWKAEMSPSLRRHFWRWNSSGIFRAKYMTSRDWIPECSLELPSLTMDSFDVQPESLDPILDGICMPPHAGPKDLKDFQFLMGLARIRNVRKIFEFGTDRGNTVANLCRFTDSEIVTLNAEVGRTSGTYRTHDLRREQIGEVYQASGYSSRVTQLYCDSLDFIAEQHAGHERFDLVIIDACHDFEYVLNDFFAILPRMSPDGCVLFHDCHPSRERHLNGPWIACCYLRKAGFDICRAINTWWGIWDRRRQSREIDDNMLHLLERIADDRHKLRDCERRHKAGPGEIRYY